MTLPHAFSQFELEQICIGSIIYKKEWKLIQANLLPHLNPISIKNKYYKMAKQGSLNKILNSKQVQGSPKFQQQSPQSIQEESSIMEEQVLYSLYKLAISQQGAI